MKKIWTLSLAIAGAVISQQASAAFFKATYTGLIRWGTDTSGVFGAANSDLSNLPFSVTFLINDSAFGAHNDFGTQSSQIRSGAIYPGSAEAVSANLLVNGISIHFSGASDSWAFQQNEYDPPSSFGIDQIYHLAANTSFDASGSDDSFVQAANYRIGGNIVDAADLRTAGEYDVSMLDSVGGFQIERQIGSGPFQLAEGNLGTTHISISAVPDGGSGGSGGIVGGVPEPASWAMMLTGFGLVGSSLRRRSGRNNLSKIGA